MSLDKSSGGDQHPDKAPGPEHRPFPGAPEDRPVPSKPAGYRSFEEIAAERAARAAGKAPGEGTGVGKDTAGSGKGPAGEGSGTADAGPRGSAAAPGSRERTGAIPGNAPARGEETRPVPRALSGQDAGRPGIPGGRRPDSLGETDRTRLRPFPGAPEDRPVPSRPVAWRSFDEIRADRAVRAGDKSTAERGSARSADRPASGQPVARDAGPSGKEVPAEKSGSRSDAGRDDRAREQNRGDGDQAGSRQAQAETTQRPAERSRAETLPRKEAPGTPGTDPPPADGQHPPGHTSSEAHGSGNKGVITHHHAEFHGQKLDLYTDGNRWVGGDAVRAAQAEAARTQTDGKPEPVRHGITDVPQMSDLGRNTVGEKEERSPGDISDLPPTGDQLLEPDDKPLSRPERFGRSLDRHIDDAKDVASNAATTAQDLIELPPSGAGHEVCQVAPPIGPEILPTPYQAADVGSIAELALVAGVLGWHSYNKAADVASRLSDKISEWRDNQHAGN